MLSLNLIPLTISMKNSFREIACVWKCVYVWEIKDSWERVCVCYWERERVCDREIEKEPLDSFCRRCMKETRLCVCVCKWETRERLYERECVCEVRDGERECVWEREMILSWNLIPLTASIKDAWYETSCKFRQYIYTVWLIIVCKNYRDKNT